MEICLGLQVLHVVWLSDLLEFADGVFVLLFKFVDIFFWPAKRNIGSFDGVGAYSVLNRVDKISSCWVDGGIRILCIWMVDNTFLDAVVDLINMRFRHLTGPPHFYFLFLFSVFIIIAYV